VLALLVEILGFGTVSTGLDFWFYNRKERASTKKAPLGIIVGIFVFYLGLILMSNVVIDVSNAYLSEFFQKAAVILVRAGLTLQTIPGALIVAVRTGHRDLLREIKREKEEKDLQKVSGNLPKVSEDEQKVTENLPKDWRKLRPTLSYEQVTNLAKLTANDVKNFSQKYGIDERTVTNWRKYAQEELSQK
jgi:uncharacterized membrane protein YcjF (UPF0283 family)